MFCRLIWTLSPRGTHGTLFEEKPYAYVRPREARKCTNGDAKLFPGTDVREASEVRPIPDMGEKTRPRGTLRQSVILIHDRARTGTCQRQLTSRDAATTALARRALCGTRRRINRFLSASPRKQESLSAAGSRWLFPSRPASRSLTTSRTSSGRPSVSVSSERQNRSFRCHGRRKRLDPLWSANHRGSRVLWVTASCKRLIKFLMLSQTGNP